MCLDIVDKLARLWDMADDEDRQGMAQDIFEEVVVNLDTRRIESFKLKPWIERFLVVRMELYRDEYPELAEEIEAELAEKQTPPADEGQGNHMPHRGSEVPACYDVWLATFHITERLYDTPYPDEPQNDLQPEKTVRNEELRQRYADGEPVWELAQSQGITPQRVSQILHGLRR